MKLAALFLAVPALLAAQGPLSVSVFEDRNGNGTRDAGERPLSGVAVSNQIDVVITDSTGSARLGVGTGMVFMSVPDRYRSVGPFWRAAASAAGASSLLFALQPTAQVRSFTFVHGSDPHISTENVERTRMFGRAVDSIRPAFAIITGDLVRDAMSQTEATARSYFDLFAAETKSIATPIWTVPGNHDHFGIIPSRSHASPTNPLYGRGMYRGYFGPDYYSFTYGGVHFVGLNTLATDDSAYYGHVDSVQLAWLRRDLSHVPSATPIVTFNHIPMVSAWEMLTGFVELPMVASIRKDENGKTTHRHTVANVLEVMQAMRGHPWVLALGGHTHAAEKLAFQQGGVMTRFEQAAAITGGAALGDYLVIPSGFTVYTVRDGVIDAGRFVPIAPGTAPVPSAGRRR